MHSPALTNPVTLALRNQEDRKSKVILGKREARPGYRRKKQPSTQRQEDLREFQASSVSVGSPSEAGWGYIV